MGINDKINFFPLILGFLMVALGIYFLYAANDIKATKNIEKYFSFVRIERLRNLDEYVMWLIKFSKLEAIAIFAISICMFIDSFFYITIILDAITLIFLIVLVTVHVYTRVKTSKFYKPANTL